MMKRIRNVVLGAIVAVFLVITGSSAVSAAEVQQNDTLQFVDFHLNPEQSVYSYEKVEMSAQASGGSADYEYRFYVIRDGKEILLRDFSKENMYIWTPYTVADYKVVVEARDTMGNTVSVSQAFSVKERELKVSFLNVAPESAVESKGTVSIGAQAEGGKGNYQYCFYVLRNGQKIILQNYSEKNVCVWRPYTAADYLLYVEAIDQSGKTASMNINYRVNTSTLAINSFVISPERANVKMQPVNISASAEGGSGQYQYCFYVLREGRKIVLQAFSPQNTCLWRPYTVADYEVCVDVSDSYGNVVTNTADYRINASNLELRSLDVSPSGEGQARNKIIISANAVNGEGRYRYRYYVIRDGREIVLKDYSEDKSCEWFPYTVADYEVCVDVQDDAGTKVTRSVSYKIIPNQLKIDSLELTGNGKIYGGEQQPIKVNISGGTAPYICQFYAIRNGNINDKIILKDFSETLDVIWRPYTVARYEVYVVVRDAAGQEISTSKNVEVVPPTVQIADFRVGNNQVAQVKQTIDLVTEARAFGNVGELQYKYYVVRDGREIILRDYNTSATASWRPVTPAQYQVHVSVMDARGNIYEQAREFEVVQQQLFVDSFTMSADDCVVPWSKVELRAQGSGGNGNLQYKFYVIRAGQIIILKDYSAENSYVWTPITVAKYQVCVDVKDERGVVATSTKELSVIRHIGQGIDVSVHNGTVDWKRVREQGLDFAMIRIAYGRELYQKDTQFENNFNGALNNGMRVGVYHYSYAATPAEARLEAKVVLTILNGRYLDLPIAFDIEEPKIHNNMNKEQATNVTMAFCDEIRKAGYTPMIYSSKYYYNTKFELSKMNGYKFWVASWGSGKPQISGITTDMWQYTSTGNVPGANTGTGCDMNYSYGL